MFSDQSSNRSSKHPGKHPTRKGGLPVSAPVSASLSSGDGQAGNRPVIRKKGKGAVSNPASRYVALVTEYEDGEAPEPAKSVQLLPEQTRRLITRNQSPDIPFDRSINPFKGCEHGCVYCFARPTHAYLDLSPGLDFETRIFYKADAIAALERELSQRSYVPKPIAIGTNTDPYQPAEKSLRITREILRTLLEHRHPVTITTKGAGLLERDLDLLAALAEHNLVSVAVSVTTLDNGLKGLLEPRTPSGARRIRAIAALREAGVPVGVMVAPLIPWINDSELETILEQASAAGATRAGYILLRLPGEVRELFAEWLAEHRPERARHVLNLVRDTRGGELYRARWGERMTGTGPVAELLRQRFEAARKRLGLTIKHPPLNVADFRVPTPQGSLF